MPDQSVIASGHPLTTEAAAYAIKSGGNAFDAALTGWLASCLAEPVLTSPAGGGFAMVCPASGAPRLYDFFTQTPRSHNPDGHSYPLEADFGSTRQVFHLGPGSVATPGCVAGILQMHADHGILPLKECIEPARDLCRNGLTITSHAATLLEVVSTLYSATPEALHLFSSKSHPDGLLREGETFVNPDFENFLEMLATEGSRWFYEGDISRMASALCQENGGHLTRRDFEDYKVFLREPLEIQHEGATIWLNPAPSMGGTLIATGLLSGRKFKTNSFPFSNRDDWANWIEPIRLMSLLRSPTSSELLDEASMEMVTGNLSKCPQLQQSFTELFPHACKQGHSSGTTQLSIIDHHGNEISMTTSNGSGSAVILNNTGFMLNNMLGEEDLQPNGMHTWIPDSRLSSMMAPTIARLPDGSRLAIGSGGSNRIRSTILQLLRHLIELKSPFENAITAPRIHWENGDLHAESSAFHELRDLASDMDWTLVEHTIPNLFFGGAHAVRRLADHSLQGIGDPRRGGSSMMV